MFKPLSLCIGLRYTRTKRRTHFISFISLSSMLGIALGVAVLITVLSVMNGFDDEIKQHVFAMAHHITVAPTYSGGLRNWKTVEKEIAQQPGVVGVAPFIEAQVILSREGRVHPALLTGIDPNTQGKISSLENMMIEGHVKNLLKSRYGLLMGSSLAAGLDLDPGDKVTVITPKADLSVLGVSPIFKRFNLQGIFQVGGNIGADTHMAFTSLNAAQRLLDMGTRVTGLRIKVADLYDAPRIARQLRQHFKGRLQARDWTEQYGAYFKAIAMEKTMMFLILMLIVAVAVFNLVASLVMVVNDKRGDIAILRTLGATPGMVMRIFIAQGTIVGLVGTLLGLLGGVLLATNAGRLLALIETLMHRHFVSSFVYFVDYLPSRLDGLDILKICGVALSMCLLATLYPAWQAGRIQPAEALRYE